MKPQENDPQVQYATVQQLNKMQADMVSYLESEDIIQLNEKDNFTTGGKKLVVADGTSSNDPVNLGQV